MCVRNQPFWRTPPGRLVVNRYDTELPAESSVELDSQRRRPSGLDVTFLDPNALVLDARAGDRAAVVALRWGGPPLERQMTPTPGLLFTSKDGGPLVRSNFRRRAWLPATVAAGLEGAPVP